MDGRDLQISRPDGRLILHDQPPRVRREQYACDITYGTNAEFGFDYLRDNGMATRKEEQVQRGHYFAIVDEVDSILIDEARTPLIISGPAVHTHDEQFAQWKPLVESLVRAQQQLCNRFLKEAEDLIKKLNPTDGSNVQNAAELEHEIGLLLFRVKTGQPKSEALMKILENPEISADEPGGTGTAQGPEEGGFVPREGGIAFAIDEKSHEADLTEKGRNFVSPKDPDAFVLPDLTTLLHDVDAGAETDARKRLEAKTKLQADFEAKAQKIHAISQLLKAYSALPDRRRICRPGKQGHHRGPAHGPAHARPPLERRPAPGGRGEGRRAIERETQTLATITIQNYFRLYQKLAGMTGTAETEAAEFFDIYKLGVLTIPDEQAEHPQGQNDSVYKTRRENSTPSSRKSRSCTRRAGRSSSARFPSRRAKCFRGCSSAKG
jgi:preprotein translocase subunit SecA